MPLLRFKVFQPIFLKIAAFFFIWLTGFLFAGNAYSAHVALAWDGVSQTGVSVTGYRVYYRTDSSSGLTKGYEGASTSCTVSDLADGETYHFFATAYNSYGESEPSDPVSYTVPDALQTFTITASAGGYGSITPSGTVSLTEGQSETFTISPTSGFHIQGVSVDGTDIGASSQYTFNEISDNHIIHATFASNPVTLHTIVATDDGHGSISPKGNVTVIEGNEQNFSITPNTGYHIADVRVDGHSVGTNSVYEFANVTEGHTISASFAANTFTITATPGSHGSITPGTITVNQGSGKTFSITANSGYEIADVVVDNQSKGSVTSYTFNDVSSNHTITADFDAVSTVSTDDDSSDSTSNDAFVDTENNVSDTGSFSSDNTSDSIADLDPSPAAIAFEAEEGIIKHPMVIAEDQVAYSGKYILIPNGDVSDGYATYTFQVTSPGNYVVWGRVLASDGESDSFFVSMDGNADSLWDVVHSTSWTWDKVNNRNGADPVVYNLAAGTHTLIIKQREMETKLDGIVISKDIDTVPSTSCFNGSSSTTTSSASSTNSGSVPSDPTSAGDVTGSSNTSASNGATTDNNSSIVTPAVNPAQEFVNQAPDRPGLLYPVDGAQDVSLRPLLEIDGFTDPDTDDDHGATRWQIATDESFGQLILDVVVDRSHTNSYLVNFLVPHGTLCSEQLYYWRASVQDARDGDPKWSNWSEPFTFITAAKDQADVNGNGVADDVEPGYSDLDNNGQNDNDQPLMRVYESSIDQSLIGINAVEGVSQINCFNSIDPESIPEEPRPRLKYGLMVFNVALEQIGGTARFELYLPEKPNTWSKWYKYDPINGWYEFPVDSDGDKYFIEITDGGFGDADGVENGIIVDPIGLADMSNDVESVDALDAVDTGDSDSTMDRLKNACFIQVALDRPAVENTAAGNLQMVAFRFIYSGLMALVLAVAVIQVTGGRRGNRTHSSTRSNSRSRPA